MSANFFAFILFIICLFFFFVFCYSFWLLFLLLAHFEDFCIFSIFISQIHFLIFKAHLLVFFSNSRLIFFFVINLLHVLFCFIIRNNCSIKLYCFLPCLQGFIAITVSSYLVTLPLRPKLAFLYCFSFLLNAFETT